LTNLTKATLFKPTRAESKQATTDSVAKQMADAEAAARRAKTERLRGLRLAKDPAPDESKVKARSRKPSKRRG